MNKFFCIRFRWFTHKKKGIHTWDFLMDFLIVAWTGRRTKICKLFNETIQCVELFVDEVFFEVLSELFLIFPLFDVWVLLPSFHPTMIENNHCETVAAMCLPCMSWMFSKQHMLTYKQFPMNSNLQVVFEKKDSKFDDTMLFLLFHPALASTSFGTTWSTHLVSTDLSKLKPNSHMRAYSFSSTGVKVVSTGIQLHIFYELSCSLSFCPMGSIAFRSATPLRIRNNQFAAHQGNFSNLNHMFWTKINNLDLPRVRK